ncbi:UvrD-helicase domain-containing protein [Sphingomonas faeni]|uniref:UvrD-helicase domain-containing protein n=1 Tax=Sphingomonas faeni TaxID=185950 RepID=UPI0020C82A0E|nr:UvrD-helicase domain-containing protein [Sphingomonas faeni]MCP8891499.1 UvrD-helicase domain-containing protein [Sphingomonas faeni]
MTEIKILKDDGARRDAIGRHDRSILVEAGAGSGKTAVMAGRVALMLAEGVAPQAIAAVTFTELAASELLSRVREFVEELAEGRIAPELRVGLPDGLSDGQRANLAAAVASIDEITCSTIHGFCQRLIKPYPVEADIDPGATVMDRAQADLVFGEIVETHLRDRLSAGQGGILAEMVLHTDRATVELVNTIASAMRGRRDLIAPPTAPLAGHLQAFRDAAAQLSAFMGRAPAIEPETEVIAQQMSAMAAALPANAVAVTAAGLVGLLVTRPHPELCKKGGGFLTYNRKGKWGAAAKAAGRSTAEGNQLSDRAKELYEACGAAWNGILQAAAGHVLAALVAEARPILEEFATYKRASAQLDFDDLINAARDMLRDHDAVRLALGGRYQRVLVDEFQDTDPLQSEILWRLCGDPGEDPSDWAAFRIRPGALFLVGDPKQAIYRFRGADVGAYVRARDSFSVQDAEGMMSISTNFRSCGSILTFVNERFEALLSSDGQPGFTALDPFHDDPAEGVCVAALEVAAADENGAANVERQRDAEAEAVADLCARLIGSHMVMDRKAGAPRPCQPGDIALLAPTGKDLWRYEEALERHGVPVATQAGKGLFRRQEVQDLIALTRVLADRRDTLALGALLRGPLVGLTEEELLDIVGGLPRAEGAENRIPRLDLNVDPETIAHELARDVIGRLQSLQRRVNSTTPHDLLSQAVELLRVRPILLGRHGRQAERALANVDLYLSLATGYSVRGLRAFAEAMAAAWRDETRAVEGRPDAQEEAVALFTMHAAKGLEWPVVIPVNTMTAVMAGRSEIVDRDTGAFYCSVLGMPPSGYEAVRVAEAAELERERVRLWYVAATRARELLILPRLDVAPPNRSWIGLVKLLDGLPAFDASQYPDDPQIAAIGAGNAQTREVFADEAAGIVERQVHLKWVAPSRDEAPAGPVVLEEVPDVWAGGEAGPPPDLPEPPAVQGGRERGLVLHKLMEEVLTCELSEEPAALETRAAELVRALGKEPVADASVGLSPPELADCVARTLAIDEVVQLRPGLLAELPVYAMAANGRELLATSGVADALAVDAQGRPLVVVDWKTDVAPDAQTLKHYRAQVRAYLDVTGATRGLIVLMTSGTVVAVTPTPQAIDA